MTWFRIDDSFGTHPKVLGIPRKDRPTAVGLWTLAGAFCARNLTDGFLGEHMVDELGVPARYAGILVKAELWHVPGQDCEVCEEWGTLPFASGYQFHDWHTYQPSREYVEEQRRADRERKKAARATAAQRREAAAAGKPMAVPEPVPYDIRAVRP